MDNQVARTIEQENEIANKIAIETYMGKGDYPTTPKLSEEQLAEVISDLAHEVSPETIRRKYSISITRVYKIKSAYKSTIDELAKRIDEEREKRVLRQISEKREQIVEAISPKDVKNANLTSKTASLVNLTQVKRLEQGLSTQNISVNVADMTPSQLERYIRTGEVIDADNVNPVVTTLEQTQNNASNPENTEINAK